MNKDPQPTAELVMYKFYSTLGKNDATLNKVQVKLCKCIQYEVKRALEADELHRAGPGSGLDNKRKDLEMIRTLWMRKGAV